MFSRVSLALLLALLAAGCTAITVNLPPITDSPTARHHNGKVVWRDLLTNTPEASQHFYGELFGWKANHQPTGQGGIYSMQWLKDKSAAGIF